MLFYSYFRSYEGAPLELNIERTKEKDKLRFEEWMLQEDVNHEINLMDESGFTLWLSRQCGMVKQSEFKDAIGCETMQLYERTCVL